jgi:hypothetical protein
MGLAVKPHVRSDIRDSIVPQIVPDVASLIQAKLALQREPIVKNPVRADLHDCDSFFERNAVRCRTKMRDDHQRRSRWRNPPHRISSYDAT